jgi:hypothetical protein
MNSKSLLKQIAFVLVSSSLYFSCDNSPEAEPAAAQIIQSTPVAEDADARKKPLVLLGGTEGVFKASAVGDAFSAANKGLSGNALIVQGFLQDKSTLYAATKDGVYASKNDGKSWSPSNSGMSGAGLNVVTLFKDRKFLFAGSFGGGVYTSTNGKDWATLNAGLTGRALIIRAIVKHDGAIYIGTHNGVYKLNEAGSAWQNASSGLTTVNDLTVVGLASTDNAIYAATFGGQLKVLQDGSSSWTTLSGLIEGFVNAVAVVGNKLYLGGNTFGVFVYDGNTFEPFNEGLPFDSLPIRAFAVKGNAVLMSTINNGTYYTIDGTTWVANSGEVDYADYWGLLLR